MPPSRTRLLAVGAGHHPRQVVGHQIVHRLPAAAEGHMVQPGAAGQRGRDGGRDAQAFEAVNPELEVEAHVNALT